MDAESAGFRMVTEDVDGLIQLNRVVGGSDHRQELLRHDIAAPAALVDIRIVAGNGERVGEGQRGGHCGRSGLRAAEYPAREEMGQHCREGETNDEQGQPPSRPRAAEARKLDEYIGKVDDRIRHVGKDVAGHDATKCPNTTSANNALYNSRRSSQ
jgi:hypothetical protein